MRQAGSKRAHKNDDDSSAITTSDNADTTECTAAANSLSHKRTKTYAWRSNHDAGGDRPTCSHGVNETEAEQRKPLTAVEKLSMLCCLAATEKFKHSTTKKVIALINALAGPMEELITFQMFMKIRQEALKRFASTYANVCSLCYSDIGNENGTCQKLHCAQRFRRAGATSDQRHIQMMTFSLEKQLVGIIREHMNLLELLQSEQTAWPAAMESVKDSPRYIAAGQRHLPTAPAEMILMRLSLSSDAFKMTKNGKVTALTATVLNLPSSIRAKCRNTLILALAFGREEPDPERFAERAVNALRRLSTTGAWVTLPDSDIQILFKAEAIAVISDCPAISGLFNMNQGYFGCFFCETRGVYDQTVRFTTFPYALKQNGWLMRSDVRRQVTLNELEHLRHGPHGQIPIRQQQTLCGYKGPSAVLDICGVESPTVDVGNH